MEYSRRIVDSELELALRTSGATLIEGAKACGKTATALQVAATTVRLDTDRAAREAASLAPEAVLGGDSPVLIDEWQLVPEIWDHVRRAVDDRSPARGQFILTGSATPSDDVRRHSGAGRFARVRMRPMSLFESGHSTGEISLRDLFHGASPSAATSLTVDDVLERIVVGGWPDRQDLPVDVAARESENYLSLITEVDVSEVGGVRRDPSMGRRVVAALARNVATEAPMTKIAADTVGPDDGVYRTTTAQIVGVLEQLQIVENAPAWGPHLRSRIPRRTSPKRHFVDPSLATAALHTGPERLWRDLRWTGFLFESLVARDLRVYSQPLGGHVLHFRDAKGVEADAIVELADGTWGAFEVKLGASRVDEAASSLLRFVERIDTTRSGEPAVLGVITATGYGYRRDDGVQVIPIGALGP